jgi:hypothetical protein
MFILMTAERKNEWLKEIWKEKRYFPYFSSLMSFHCVFP